MKLNLKLAKLINFSKVLVFYNNKIVADDKRIVSVLKHYFENIVIEEDKFLLGWSCKLWNKEAELDVFIDNLKDEHKCISIYDAYIEYTKYSNNSLIASKRYFEKFILENYHENIEDEDDLHF